MIIDELIEKWQKEYNVLNNNQEEIFIQPYHDFIVDLKRLKEQQKNNGDKLLNRIQELEDENKKLKNDIENYKEMILDLERKLNNERNNINFNTNEIEKDVAIRVLAEMVAEK